MKFVTIGGRFAVASLSVCLTVLLSTAPSYAINQVIAANPDGGITCVNCGTNRQMTQVVNADGSVTVQTWPISDFANGNQGAYATGWNNASIPVGGSASISINQTAPNGSSFTAGFRVDVQRRSAC